MAKKLTDIETFYVKANPDNLSPKELAAKLGCSLHSITKLTKVKAPLVNQEPEPTLEVVPEPAHSGKGPDARRTFGRVRKKGTTLATVMTEASSQVGDEASKLNRRNINDIPALKNAIYRPYGDENRE